MQSWPEHISITAEDDPAKLAGTALYCLGFHSAISARTTFASSIYQCVKNFALVMGFDNTNLFSRALLTCTREQYFHRICEYEKFLLKWISNVRKNPSAYTKLVVDANNKTTAQFKNQFKKYRHKLSIYRRMLIINHKECNGCYKDDWFVDDSKLSMTENMVLRHLRQKEEKKNLPLLHYIRALNDFHLRLKANFESRGVSDFGGYNAYRFHGKEDYLKVFGMNGPYFNKPNDHTYNTEFMKEVYDWLDNMVFARDDFMLNSKGGRYVRVESSLQSGIFTFSNGKVVIPTEELSSMGKRILSWMNKNIYELRNRLIHKYLYSGEMKEDYSYFVMELNTLQIVANGDYGFHDDSCPEMTVKHNQCSESSPLCKLLPRQEEQDVVTLVFVFDEKGLCDFDRDDDKSGSCRLTHKPTHREANRANPGKSKYFETKSQSLHYQYPGLQVHCQHQAKPLYAGQEKSTGRTRVVISGRFTVEYKDNKVHIDEAMLFWRKASRFVYNEHVCKRSDMKWFKRVLSKPQSPLEVTSHGCRCGSSSHDDNEASAAPLLDDVEGRQADSSVVVVHSNSWPSWKNAEYVGLQNPGTKTEIPQDSFRVVRGYRLTRKLIENGMFLQVYRPKQQKDNAVTWNYLRYPCKPGTCIPTPKVRSDNGIANYKEHSQILNWKKAVTDTLVLERKYKNDAITIGTVMKHLKDGDEDYLYNRREGELMIWITAQGGSATVQGAVNAPKIDDPNKETTLYIESWQNDRHFVSALTQCVESEAVIQLFAPKHWMDTDSNHDRSNKDGVVMSLGLWYFDQCIHGRHPHLYTAGERNTSWALEQSYLYRLRPLWNSSYPRPSDDVVYQEKKKIFWLSTKSPRISCWIPREDQMINITSEWIQITWFNEKLQQMNFEEERHDPAAGNEIEDDDDDKDNYGENNCLGIPIKHYQINLHEMVHEFERLSVAFSARFQRCHVQDDGSAGILCGSRWSKLGWLHGIVPIPHPIRTYNAQTFVYLESKGRMLATPSNNGRTKYSRFRQEEMDARMLVDSLYSAIVLRTTGNPTLFVEYCRSFGSNSSDDRIARVPSIEEHETFKEFLLKQAGGPRSRMSKFSDVLYAKSHLQSSRGTVGAYLNFLDKILHELVHNTSEMRQQWNILDYQEQWSYEDWIGKLATILKTADGNAEGKPDFLASLILLDIEEIVELNIPGMDETCVLGVGGERGMSLIECDQCERLPLEIARGILSHLRHSASDESLTMMGLYRKVIMEEPRVFVLLNDREATIRDVDNMMCKLSISQVYTTGSRRVSERPRFFRNWDLPLPVSSTESSTSRDCNVIMEICTCCLSVFDHHWTDTKAHHQFMFHNEEERWPVICSEFDRGAFQPVKPVERRPKQASKRKKQSRTTTSGVSRTDESWTTTSVDQNVIINMTTTRRSKRRKKTVIYSI